MRTCVIFIWVFLALPPFLFAVSSPEAGRLNQAISLKLGDHQVSLPAGTQVQVLNKGDVTSVVSFQLAGAPVITQIPSDQLVFLAAAAPKRGTPASATASAHAGATLSGSSPSISVIPVSEAPSSPMTVPNDQQQEDADEPLPDFKTTLSPSDIELPAVQFTALNGSFYVVINGAPV